jgi:hypothetical protein
VACAIASSFFSITTVFSSLSELPGDHGTSTVVGRFAPSIDFSKSERLRYRK